MLEAFQHNTAAAGLPTRLQICALLTSCCLLCAGSAFKQAGEAVAGAAKDVYSQSVQFARQEWNGMERAINTVEGALQVKMCPCMSRMTITCLLAMQNLQCHSPPKSLQALAGVQ